MKLMIINSSLLFFGHLFSEALKPHFEEVHFCGPQYWSHYEYLLSEKECLENYVGLGFDPKDYDIILSTDHGTLRALAEIKRDFPDKIVGVQVLDYPQHVFKKNKDWNESVTRRWEKEFIPSLGSMDFIIHNKITASEALRFPDIPSEIIKFPVNRFVPVEKERKDFIVYSGRLIPQKGVYYVISALALLEDKPKFVTIGEGFNYSEYAQHLGVEYENVCISEKEKWQLYQQSRFLICGADNPYITSLAILEGISINRAGLVFDFSENQNLYGLHAWYCPPCNIESMARTIDCLYHDPKLSDDRAKNGSKFYEEECSYGAWGKKVHKLIKDVCCV